MKEEMFIAPKKVKLACLKIATTEKIINQAYMENKELKEKVINYMRKQEQKKMKVTNDYSITLVEKTALKFDIEKMEKVFSKDIMKQITVKDYSIDKEKMRNLFKKYPMMKKEFMEVLVVNKKVDSDKVENMLLKGQIKREKILPCVSVGGSSFLKLNIKEK